MCIIPKPLIITVLVASICFGQATGGGPPKGIPAPPPPIPNTSVPPGTVPNPPAIVPAPFVAAIVRGEIPKLLRVPTWSLAYPPINGVDCFWNGLHQSEGLDYTMTGSLITAPAWAATDDIRCNYMYNHDN